jgi:hypothetical protein
MSAISPDTAADVDVQEQLTRIRRMQVESDKFMAGQRKLIAEASKLDRDRWISIWVALSASLGATAAAVATTIGMLRVIGVPH